jgi:hypothetical protein
VGVGDGGGAGAFGALTKGRRMLCSVITNSGTQWTGGCVYHRISVGLVVLEVLYITGSISVAAHTVSESPIFGAASTGVKFTVNQR